jgi:hypothetical protein
VPHAHVVKLVDPSDPGPGVAAVEDDQDVARDGGNLTDEQREFLVRQVEDPVVTAVGEHDRLVEPIRLDREMLGERRLLRRP